MTKKKKKEEKPPKVKNLGDVHKETLEAISKGINQVGIEWQKDEPWEDLESIGWLDAVEATS